jgi:hypothetical protein
VSRPGEHRVDAFHADESGERGPANILDIASPLRPVPSSGIVVGTADAYVKDDA